MPQAATSVQAGWRPDPSGRFEWRYWDGGWTNRVANTATSGAPPADPAPSPAPTAGATSTAAPGADGGDARNTTIQTDPAPVPTPPSATLPAPTSVTTTVPDAALLAAAATAMASSTPPAPPAPPVSPEPAVAVAAASPAAPAAPVQPFGVESPSAPVEPARERKTPWAWATAFARSFADQPDSFHGDLPDTELPPDPRGERMVTTAPGNYGHAGIIALAACGIAGGAYLPWLSGTIDTISFHRTGFDLGHGFGYCAGAAALALSALIGVRFAILRWVTLTVAIVLAGFIVRELVNTYDDMQTLNMAARVSANVGEGLWIMIVSSAISLIALVRSNEDEKII
jgi:hypothetical protein